MNTTLSFGIGTTDWDYSGNPSRGYQFILTRKDTGESVSISLLLIETLARHIGMVGETKTKDELVDAPS